MVAAPEYSLGTQHKIILALCVMQIFICVHNTMEDLGQNQEITRRVPQRIAEDFGQNISTQEKVWENSKQESIAKAMWEQYQEYIGSR